MTEAPSPRQLWYEPFLLDEDQHGDEKAEEEDHSDRDEDHGVDGVWVTCWVKTLQLAEGR